jgi:hypothetical protein
MAFNGFVSNKGGTGKRKALGNATPDKVRSPYTFSTPQGYQQGTILDKNGVVITPSGVDQVIGEGYYPGTLAGGKVAAVVVDASKVLEGTTIAGTPGALANKPGQVVSAFSHTLQNLVTDGSFEIGGATGWNGSAVASDQGKFGNGTLAIIGNASVPEVVAGSPPFSYIQGHKYYVSIWFKANGVGTSCQMLFPLTAPYPNSSFPASLADTWYRNSFISADASIASGSLQLRLDNDNNYTTVAMRFDGLCIIDLTACFGAGSEPTLAQMDSLMDLFGGWFDGSVVIEKISQGGYVTNGLSGTPEVLINMVNLIPSVIRNGFGLRGITGNYDYSALPITSGAVLSGKEGFVNGAKVTGTMPNYPAANYAGTQIGAGNSGIIYITPNSGYYAPGANVYIQDGNYVAANILAGKSIFGVAGSAPIRKYATGVYAPGGTITTVSVSGLAFNLVEPFVVVLRTNLGYHYAKIPDSSGYSNVYGRLGSTAIYGFGSTGSNWFNATVAGCTSVIWWVFAY